MIRKVSQIGPSTLMVSLPSKWVKKQGITKGDEIELIEGEQHLKLSPKGTAKEIKEKDLEFRNVDDQFIRLTLNNLYRTGFDKLNIRFDSIKKFETIQGLSNNSFLGFEVTKKEKNSCILENVTEPHEEKYDILLRRLFLIIKESLSMVDEDFRIKNYNIVSLLSQQFNKTEQFSNFCMRSINKNSSEKSSLNYLILYNLLVMEGELRHMYEFIDKNKDVKISKDTIKLISNIQAVFDRFYNAFFKKDSNLLAELNKDAKKLLYEDAYSLLNTIKGKENIIVYHLTIFIRLITLVVSPTLGII